MSWSTKHIHVITLPFIPEKSIVFITEVIFLMFLMPTDNMLDVNCCTVVVTARIMPCSCGLRGTEGLPYVGIGINIAENS